jgi:hypothetical protein
MSQNNTPQPSDGHGGLWLIVAMLAVIVGLFLYSNWTSEFSSNHALLVDAQGFSPDRGASR